VHNATLWTYKHPQSTWPPNTRTSYRSPDFPSINCNASVGDDYFIPPLAVVFLFEISSSEREEILQQLEQNGPPSWPESLRQHPLSTVPWRRTFTLIIHDVVHMAADGLYIYISQELFKDDNCLVAHDLSTVYPLFWDCEKRTKSPAALHHARASFPVPSHRLASFTPDPEEAVEAEADAQSPLPFAEIPVIVTAPITTEQEAYLYALLPCEEAESTPGFLHVPNPSPESINDVKHVMSYLEKC
jgi:hypothetical protein